MRLKYGCAFWEYNKQNRFFLGAKLLYLYLLGLFVGLLPDFPYVQITLVLITQITFFIYVWRKKPYEDLHWSYAHTAFHASRIISIVVVYAWAGNYNKIVGNATVGISVGLQFLVGIILAGIQLGRAVEYIVAYCGDICEGGCLNLKYIKERRKIKKGKSSVSANPNSLTHMLEMVTVDGKNHVFRSVQEGAEIDLGPISPATPSVTASTELTIPDGKSPTGESQSEQGNGNGNGADSEGELELA